MSPVEMVNHDIPCFCDILAYLCFVKFLSCSLHDIQFTSYWVFHCISVLYYLRVLLLLPFHFAPNDTFIIPFSQVAVPLILNSLTSSLACSATCGGLRHISMYIFENIWLSLWIELEKKRSRSKSPFSKLFSRKKDYGRHERCMYPEGGNCSLCNQGWMRSLYSPLCVGGGTCTGRVFYVQ